MKRPILTLKTILARLFQRPHRHSWQESAWNEWANPMEERCKCGARRHRKTWNDTLNDRWIEGPHPIAQRLRTEGKSRTNDWSGAW